jgi:cytidine deaminase
MTDRELVERAFAMLERAYAPYSRFPVGAALLCGDGEVFTGCNVENASYGATICAERTALVKAVSRGRRDGFERLAVAADSADYCWPCGICRQMLYEFAPGLELVVARADREFIKIKLSELLPHGFGPANLKTAALKNRACTERL